MKPSLSLFSSPLKFVFALSVVLMAASECRGQAAAPAVALGNVNMGSSASGTVTFTFSAQTVVSSVSVVTQGSPGLDFQPGTAAVGSCTAKTYQANDTCTTSVNFTPLAAGVRLGAVNLLDASANLLATAFVSGKGLGGQFASPGKIIPVNLHGGPGTVTAAAEDGAGNLYYVGSAGITRVTTAGVVTTCGCGLNGPVAVAIDGSGQIFVGGFKQPNLYGNLYQVNFAAGTSTDVPNSYGLGAYGVNTTYPVSGVVADGSGNLYINGQDDIIELLRATNTNATTESNNTIATWGVAVDSQNTVYFTSENRTPYVIVSGAAQAFSGVANPYGITVTPDDNVLVAAGGTLYSIAAANAGVTTQFSGIPSPSYQLSLDVLGNVLIPSQSSALYVGPRTTPTVLASAPTALGSLSAEQTVTFTNTGSAPAAPGGFVAAGAVVLGPSTTCNSGTAVPVGGTCVVGLQFKPTQHGPSPQTGTITSTGTSYSTFSATISGNVTGDPTQVAFTPAPASSLVAGGNAGTITATLEDSTGNTAVTTNTLPITLTVTYPGGGTVTYRQVNAVNGVATFDTSTHRLTQSGTYTYTVSSPGLTSGVANETVTGAPIASLAATASPATIYAGMPVTVSFTAYDQFGNLAAATSDTLTLTSTDGSATLPAPFALNGSTGSKTVTFNQGGTFTVTVADTTNTAVTSGRTGNVVVTAVPVYIVTSSSDPATGTAANCPDQSAGATGNNTACTLRDAFAAVDAAGMTGLTGPQPLVSFAASVPSVVLTGGVLAPAHNYRLSGNGASVTSISGGGTQSILNQTAAGIHTTISNLILKSGFIATGTLSGGAFNMTGGSTTDFNNVVFSGNQAARYGGAIYAQVTTNSGTLNITSSSFDGNTTTGTVLQGGGAVAVLGSVVLVVNNSTFTNNTATTSNANAADGGAIFSTATLTGQVNNSSFTGNKVTSVSGILSGGAVYCSGSTLNIKNTLIANNLAVSSTTAAANGGGVYLTSATINLTGSTLVGNSAKTNGGGLYRLGTSVLNLYSDTVTGNSAANDGGVDILTNSNYNAYNTLIGGNTATSTYNDSNVLPVAHTNLINSASVVSATLTPLPQLSALGSFGGPVIGAGALAAPLLTQLPLPGSPLLGAGSTAYISPTLAAGPTVDSRGLPRFTTLSTGVKTVDVGAAQANFALAFVQQPTNTQVNTAFAPLPTVQVTESFLPFNATPYNSATPGVLTLTPASGVLANASVTLPNSTAPATFSSGSTFSQPQVNDSLTVSVTNPAFGLGTVSSSFFNVSDNAAAMSIGFSTAPPASLRGGGNAGIVRVALLMNGATDTTSSSNVTLTVSGTAAASYGPVAAVNGIATFDLSGTALAPGTYTYTASSPYTTETVMANETVAAPVLTSLALSGLPASSPTGRPQSLVVTALDQFGNPFTGFTGTVSLTSTDALAVLSPTSYTYAAAENGVHTFQVTLGTAGRQSITATSGAFSATITTVTSGYVSVLSSNGSITRLNGDGSLAATYAGTGTIGLALDFAGDLWSLAGNTLNEISRTGISLSGSGFTGGGLNAPSALAIDGLGQVWITNSNGTFSQFSNAGTALSPATGYAASGALTNPAAISVDSAGSLWIANPGTNAAVEVIGAAAPVVTPAVSQTLNANPGTRP